MKIQSATIGMDSSHHSATLRERQERLRVWNSERAPARANPDTGAALSISRAAQRALAADRAAPQASAGADATAELDAIDGDPFLGLLKSMIEFLTGRPVRVFSPEALQATGPDSVSPPPPSPENVVRAAIGFGLDYQRHEVHEEFESASFTAEGVVRTDDGREIRFSLSLTMERYYREESHTSLRIGEAVRKDPLVLSFDGTAAQLLDRSFRFDLDADGNTESLPLLGSGHGYLAFDRNANGRIDSGRELFGPATGHGFAELAELDADANGWIDEADPAFARLSIWQPSADGHGDLRSLAAGGIGAIGLTSIRTPFELRGNGNRDLGAIRSTAIALTEAGRVLPVQEIDLTVT